MKRFIMLLAGLLFSGLALAAININTATLQELEALNGIGPVKAQAIIDYRTQNGPFRSVDEVRKVRGIGEKLFQQIKPELTIAGSGPRAAVASAAISKSALATVAGGRGRGGEFQIGRFLARTASAALRAVAAGRPDPPQRAAAMRLWLAHHDRWRDGRR